MYSHRIIIPQPKRLLQQSHSNVLEERARGDANAFKEQRRRGTNRQKVLADEEAAVGALQRPLTMADLWRATDNLVEDGGPALSQIASAQTSLVGGYGLQRSYAGQPAQFTLVARSPVGVPLTRGGTAWVVTITGPGRTESAVTDHSDGVYTVTHVCSCSGRYRLAVRLLDGHHLTGSPFDVVVHKLPLHRVESLTFGQVTFSHTLGGLFNRWFAYVPLVRLWRRRTKSLRECADSFRFHAWGSALIEALTRAAERQHAIAELHVRSYFTVLRKRARLTLVAWRRVTYIRMGAELTLAMARRALNPTEKAAALHLWSYRLATARDAAQQHKEAIRRAAFHLLQRDLHRSWHSWAALVHQRDALARVASRMLQSGVARAWGAWAALLAERDVMRHVAVAMTMQQVAQAFRAMMQAAVDRSCALRTLDVCVALMSMRGAAKAVASWVDFAHARAVAFGKLRRAVSTMMNHEVAIALHSWRVLVETQTDALAALRRSVAFFTQRDQATAWRSWVEMATERAASLRALQRGAAALMASQQVAAWNTWREHAVDAGAARTALRQAGANFVARGTVLALRAWIADYVATRLDSGQMRTADKAMVRIAQSGRLRQWRQAARWSRALEHGAKLLHREAGRALRSWQAMIAARIQVLDALDVGVRRWQRAEVVGAIAKWREVADAQAASRSAALKLIGSLVGSRRLAAWNTWVANAIARAGAFDAMSKAIGAFVFRGRSRALQRWMEMAAKQTSTYDRMQNTAARLCHMQTGRAVRQWVGFVAERRLLLRAAQCLVDQQRRMAWRTWVDHTVVRARSLATLKHVVHRICYRGLFDGLRQWQNGAKWSAALQRGARVLCQDQTHALRTWQHMVSARTEVLEALRVGVAKWRYAEVAGALARWRDATAACAVVRAAAMKLFDHDRALALRTWSAFTTECVAALTALRRVASVLLNRSLSKAWSTWCELTAAHATSIERLHGAFASWQRQELASAWRRWQEVSFADQAQTQLLSAAAFRLSHQQLLATWTMWCEHSQQATRYRGVLMRWVQSTVAGALRAWRGYADDRAEALMLLGGAATVLTHRGMAAAWNMWCEVHAERIDEWLRKEALQRVVRHLLNMQLARAWRQLTDVASGRGEARSRLHSCITRLTRQGQLRALSSWTSFVMARTHALQSLHRVATTMVDRNRAIAWRTWEEFATVRATNLERAARTLATMTNREKARAWSSWCEGATEHAKGMHALTAAAACLTNRGLAAAWRSWLEFMSARAAKFDEARAVGARILNQRASEALRQWVSCWSEMVVVHRALVTLLNRGRALAWRAWIEYRAQRVASLAKLRHSIGHIIHRQLSSGLRQWQNGAQWSAALQRGARVLFQTKGRAFASWWARTTEAAASTRAARFAIARWILGELLGGLMRWRDQAAKHALMHEVVARMVNLQRSRAFRSWASTAAARVSALHRLHAGVGRWMYRKRSRAMAGWRHNAHALGVQRLGKERARWRVHQKKALTLAWWRALCWKGMRRRLVKQKEKLAIEVQRAMLSETEQQEQRDVHTRDASAAGGDAAPAGGTERIVALTQQNAALRASAVAMAENADRVAAQVQAVLGPHTRQQAAVGWYVHFLEMRVEDMRRQVHEANAAADSIERVLNSDVNTAALPDLAPADSPRSPSLFPSATKPGAPFSAFSNMSTGASAAWPSSASGAPSQPVPSPLRTAPTTAPTTAQRARGVSFAFNDPFGTSPAPAPPSAPSMDEAAPGYKYSAGKVCTYEMWQGFVSQELIATELAKEWADHRPGERHISHAPCPSMRCSHLCASVLVLALQSLRRIHAAPPTHPLAAPPSRRHCHRARARPHAHLHRRKPHRRSPVHR